ncbi:MAG: 4a-hydroxytetrahydrobiopterin dehydratase [Cellvibrionales bacterium]|nr:4a-hydroxytetrahydrobiopterin dehydratase [Cellvibrionales bacterium]|tara:strand:- start:4148 stop:4435 length:288 start_codon:yes stop_codon:yes gene_type:complete
MKDARLTESEIQAQAAQLSDWQLTESGLVRQFTFADFTLAFEFMRQVAVLAERANHHPEWSNVYSKVDITLTTHEYQGVSQRDFDLANAIDRINL